MHVAGGYAYVSASDGFLYKIDVSNPASPVIVLSYDTGLTGATDVTLRGDYLYWYRSINWQSFKIFERWFDSGANAGQSLSLSPSGKEVRRVRVTAAYVDSIAWELTADGGAFAMFIPVVQSGACSNPGGGVMKLWRVLDVVLVLFVFVGLSGCGAADDPVDTQALVDAGTGPLGDKIGFPPPPSGETRVIVLGDTQTGMAVTPPPWVIHDELVPRIVAYDPRRVFIAGDVVERGTQGNWNDFCARINANLPSGTTIFPAIGNHDVLDDTNLERYFGKFDYLSNQRYYVARVGGPPTAVFIVLDVSAGTDQPRPAQNWNTQKNWLNGVLDNPAYADLFKFVMFHVPYWTDGERTRNRPDYVKELDDIFFVGGVRRVHAVFQGHTHAYERWNINGIPYFVSGGAGAELHGWVPPAPLPGPPYNSEFHASVYNYLELTITPTLAEVRPISRQAPGVWIPLDQTIVIQK